MAGEDELNTSRHSYLDTDESLLSSDFNYAEKFRLDSRMQLKYNASGHLFDSDSSHSEVEALFDEAEKRAQQLMRVLRRKISQVLNDDESALSDVGIKLIDPDHHHNLSLETFCSLYRGLYEIVELCVQHLICIPSELVENFDPERVLVTKALILAKCKEYFRLVHVTSYAFISCGYACPIVFNHAKVVKFMELLLQPIEDLKLTTKCLKTLAGYVSQVLDPTLEEHQEILHVTTAFSSLDLELEELTGYPDYIPVHLNLQIKFDEIRHKEAHQIKCLQTVKEHLEELRQFAKKETQPFLLPEVLNVNVYRDFLLHPLLIDMVFGNCMQIVEVHEKLLMSLDSTFVDNPEQIPELTNGYCSLISKHYEEHKEVYAELIGEVVFTSELIELLTSKCPEFAFFLKKMAEKSQKSLSPHRGKYTLAGVYQNIARHIMSYSNFFSVIEDLVKQKSCHDWNSVVDRVKDAQVKIKETIKYLNDVTEARCIAHACLGAIADLPICVLFSRGQNLKMPPAIIKFGFNGKPKEDALLYLFSGLIEIAHKKRPYSLLLTKDENKTQSHSFHLHLESMKNWKWSKESPNVVKVIPSKEAMCNLNVPHSVLKSLHCKNNSADFSHGATFNNGTKSAVSPNYVFLKFQDSSVLDKFLSHLH